jgi:predicted RNA binding protein YcfA (HicA-like mRNA interferase family)
MTARDLIKQLEAAGWVEVRQSGSHRNFKHPAYKKLISVPDHAKKDLKPGLLNTLLKQAGLK